MTPASTLARSAAAGLYFEAAATGDVPSESPLDSKAEGELERARMHAGTSWLKFGSPLRMVWCI